MPVTGIDGIQLAVEAILKGEMAGTVAWDPFWQGGMGLSIGYHAKTGKFDPSKEPKEHREFYGTGVIDHRARTPRSSTTSNIKAEPQARLERHLGPRQRPDPVQLSAGAGRCARPPWRAAAASHARERMSRWPTAATRTLRRRAPRAAPSARRLGAAAGAGGCSAPSSPRSTRNFLTFGNFVRISQTAMIPLVLGLGATFIILMGSIDLSVEGVLTLGAVILSPARR